MKLHPKKQRRREKKEKKMATMLLKVMPQHSSEQGCGWTLVQLTNPHRVFNLAPDQEGTLSTV